MRKRMNKNERKKTTRQERDCGIIGSCQAGGDRAWNQSLRMEKTNLGLFFLFLYYYYQTKKRKEVEKRPVGCVQLKSRIVFFLRKKKKREIKRETHEGMYKYKHKGATMIMRVWLERERDGEKRVLSKSGIVETRWVARPTRTTSLKREGPPFCISRHTHEAFIFLLILPHRVLVVVVVVVAVVVVVGNSSIYQV